MNESPMGRKGWGRGGGGGDLQGLNFVLGLK